MADIKLWVLVDGFIEFGILVPATVSCQIVGFGDLIFEIDSLEIMLLENFPSFL